MKRLRAKVMLCLSHHGSFGLCSSSFCFVPVLAYQNRRQFSYSAGGDTTVILPL